jgi:SAM-dependent methyltransferase
MSVPQNWYQTFFTGAVVDHWLNTPSAEQTRSEADFIQAGLQVSPPARLLDVPCGGGRHALALAARGFRVTGVDISADFLAAARAQSAGNPAVTWEQRDMRDLPWTEAFDGAYSFGNSFGYADEAGNAAFLLAVARALRPGAILLMDTSYIAEVILPSLQERAWYPWGEDGHILAQRRYDPPQGRLEVEYTYVRGGKSEKCAMSARIYSYREVCGLLRAAGFTDMQGWGSLEKEPFRLGSHRLLLSGRKATG